jgi:TonB family C-terminal domain
MTWTKEDMFEPSGCLTREAFEALVNHQLPAEAKAWADEHIASCPFCADALEGFASQTSDFYELMGRTDDDFADLIARVQSKSHLRRILLVTLSTAASILMFVGLFMMINKPQPKMQVAQKVIRDTHSPKSVNAPKVLADVPKIQKSEKVEPESPPPASERKTVRFTPPVVSDTNTAEMETKDDLKKETVAPLEVQSAKAEDHVTDSENSLIEEDKTVDKVSANFKTSIDKRASVSRSAEPVAEEQSAQPLSFVEQMPEFPGGIEAMTKFISEHLKYPSTAAEMGISGKVILQFLVKKNGKITDIKVVRSIGGGCDEEAVRVVKLMPEWIPGKQNGKPTSVYFTLPVNFSLLNH